VSTAASKYFGGEQRIAKTGANSMVIAFPGAALGANQPEIAVLVGLLGGESTIKWSPGFSLLSKAAAAAPGATAKATNFAYSDAGLLTVQINGPAAAVRKTAEESVKALKAVAEGGVSQENLVKAIAKAKFNLLSGSEVSGTGLVHAGANLIHGGQPLQVAESLKALEGVNADKLKAVSLYSLSVSLSLSSCQYGFARLTPCNTGGQDTISGQGVGGSGWRPARIAVRRGPGAQGIDRGG
jgi:ubiquinol-cytochrome c reductase core subunit 2